MQTQASPTTLCPMSSPSASTTGTMTNGSISNNTFKLPTPQDIQRQLWQIQQQVASSHESVVAPSSPDQQQQQQMDLTSTLLGWVGGNALTNPFFDPDSMWKLRNLQLIQANLVSLQESLNSTLQEAASLVHGTELLQDSMVVDGVCQWPGCSVAGLNEELTASTHLNLNHGLDFNSIGQIRVQMQCVRSLEAAVAKEKSKLGGMVSHLRENSINLLTSLSTNNSSTQSSNNQSIINSGCGLPTATGMYTPPTSMGGGPMRATRGRPSDKSGTPQLCRGDLAKNRDFYNSNDIRPPFTYASLIRQAIAEAPNMQLTLNEIYIWFQRNFAYFRRNEATWKNAVRHNLSLHKCFARVENVKGAVWTVDEAEYSNRRSQRIISGSGSNSSTPVLTIKSESMAPMSQESFNMINDYQAAVFEAGNEGSNGEYCPSDQLAINLSSSIPCDGSETASAVSDSEQAIEHMDSNNGSIN